jgi:hypothetical protein
MSNPNEAIIEAIKAEAIERMNSDQLVERAVALRAPLHNMLDIEPIDVRGGTLYTVTSGIVAEAVSHVTTDIEGNEIVRRHVIPDVLTLFADVVELPRHNNRWHQAQLYRFEGPLEPVLAEARGPFRSTLLAALAPDRNNYSPPIHFGAHYHVSYPAEKAVETDAGTLLNARAGSSARILGGPGAVLDTETVGTSQLDSIVGVRTSLSGPVRTPIEPYQFALVTDRSVQAGPKDQQFLQFTLPEGTKQHLGDFGNPGKYERIPDDAKIGLDDNGRVVMTGDRTEEYPYKDVNLQPYISGSEVGRLLPPETAEDWADVTETFVKRLRDRLPDVLPLDTAGSWEQTIGRAREQVREALLAHREPVLGGVGNLAVAALVAELPSSPGDYRPINKQYFTRIR